MKYGTDAIEKKSWEKENLISLRTMKRQYFRLIKSANIWKRLHYKKPIERKLSNIASLNRHKKWGKKDQIKENLNTRFTT